MKKAFYLLFICLPLLTLGQPGKNGALTVTTANTVVNCYTGVTANVTAGTSTVTTTGTCAFQCGDLIMIYQAQGASINTSNTASYGTITAMNNAGLYEFNYVLSTAGGVITVQNPWVNNYTATGFTQIVKVPQYTTLTVNAGASIVPLAWQDAGAVRIGGIVAIHATGTVTVNGTIHANGFGFRPGPLDNSSSGTGATLTSVFVSTSANDGAAKGESIAGNEVFYDANGGRYGRGAPANGGGGGNGHNGGGGGGSNGNNGNAYNGNGVMCTACTGTAAWALDPYTISAGGALANSSGGGRGGYTYGASNQNALVLGTSQAAWGGDQRDPFGGLGGRPLTISPASRIFFGGGGGAGDRNNNANQLGGTGGGIVYIIANAINGAGQINSNGSDALNQIALGTGGANDAPSGGGGGGSVVLRSPAITGINSNARGGKGGDQGFLSSESEGPGGGGGGGIIAFSGGSPGTNVSGGDNGITLSGSLTEFTPNGSTIGGSGETGSIGAFTLVYNPIGPIVTNATTPVCQGSPINFTTTGIPGCTYAWSGPPSFSSSIQNPTIPSSMVTNTGTFQVIYTTAGGCKDTNFVNVVVNPLPVLTPSATMPLCNGSCTGSINAVTTSGTSPFSYSWSSGPTTQIINSLCAGSYTVTVTDINGCLATSTVAITQPLAINATLAAVNPLCAGACNGTITVTAGGGTGTLEYSVDGGPFQLSNLFTGLCAGLHTVIVRDANGCTFNISITLNNPPVLNASLTSTTPATCGINNGIIVVNASGGTGALSYDLNPGPVQATGTFTGLAPGSYSVIVSDANGCTTTVTGITVGSSPSPIASIISVNNVSCFGGLNGSVLIGATGGTGTIQYQIDPPGAIPPTPFQLSNSFVNLTAGTYGVTIVDANGCTGTTTFTITQPPQLTYTTTFTNVNCNGACDGTITITPAGGTPGYEFSSNAGLSFSTANPLTGLCAGAINVVVQDANGCLSNSTVNLTQPAPLVAGYTLTNPVCPGACDGQIIVTGASGGTGTYQYSVNGGPLQLSNTLTGLCAGPNNVVVQDANGCQLTSIQNLVDPPGFNVNVVNTTESNCGFNNGSFEVAASGGFAPYSYNCITCGTPPQPTGLFTTLVAGGYDVEVTDANGCVEQLFVGVNDIEMDGILDALTDATCFGSCDGTVATHAINGSPPIQYELDLSGSFFVSGDFTGLCAGSHIVTIVDNGFCIFTIPFTIAEPDPVLFSSTTTNVACNGGATGSITITGVTGGNGAYEYSIDGGTTYQTSPLFTGLAATTYTLSVMDGNGCLGSGTATITEGTPLTYTTNIDDLTCFGNNTGFLQLVASGGTGPYTYSINGGSTFSAGFTFVSLAAGNYNVVIQDALGCQVSGIETINQPTPLVAGYVMTPTLCNGSCDGIIDVTASGGTAPYQYSDDNGTTYQLTPSLGGLCAGSYQVVVRDSNNCIVGSSITVTQPPVVSYTPLVVNETCGSANGSITFSAVAGGTPTYQFSIDGGTTFLPTAAFTGLSAATYSLMVEDDNGCTFPASANILNESNPVINAAFVTDVTCNAACNGELNATASGGTGALNFDIGGASQLSGLFTGICAGAYTLTVTDANGCTDTQPITVIEPPVLTLAPTGTNLLCFNDFTGSVTITAGGGTTPYMFSYDNGTTFTGLNNQTNLAAGTYNLVVTDNNGCTVTGTQTLTEPTAVVIASQSSIDPLCFASCDGEASVNISGGTVSGLYTYTWSGGVAGTTQNTATGLCSGTYTLDITDDNGCLVSTSFTLLDPAPYVITSTASTDVLCNGDCNGTITVTSAAGVQFSIDNGTTFQPAPNFTGLCPGVYPIQAVNANGCVATSVAVLNEPTPVTVVSTPDSIYCIGAELPLFAFAFGGTPGYTYTWSNGIVAQTQNVNPVGTVTYDVFATDANGCISNTASTTYSPLPNYTASIAATELITCPGDTVTIDVALISGNPFYEYAWNTGDTTASITLVNNAAATYTVIVNDQCFDYDTLTIDINTYNLPNVSFTSDVTSGCQPLTVNFTNTTPPGEVGGTCTWTFSDGSSLSGCGTVTGVFNTPGCYNVDLAVTSPDGCVNNLTQTNFFCVYPNPVADFYWSPVNPTILFNNEVTFNNASILGDSYLWDFAGMGASSAENPVYQFNLTDTGYYQICLQVTTTNGCVDDTCKQIYFGDDFSVYVPNAFTPDGDGTNDLFFPVALGFDDAEFEFMIFNRWGELIFMGTGPRDKWDGTHEDIQCKEDVYVWKLLIKDNNNGKHEYIGHVTLLR